MSNDNADNLDVSDLHAAIPAIAAETLSPNVRKRVETLREIQSEHGELEKKFSEEIAALEAKYQQLYEPLYTKRYEIVNGVTKVEGEINEAATDEGDKGAEEKGVPDFWLTAMKTNDILAAEISERDEGALKYLKDIKWSRVDDPKGFKLEFLFDSNPYFKNSVLEKTYHVVDDGNEPILEKAIGTKIEWYPGKCLTQKADELQDRVEHDYNIGSVIQEKLIPHAVSWFTGEAVQGDEFDGLEGDYDDSDDEDGDEEDDDEDEDEEEESKGKKKRGGTAKAGHAQQTELPPQCPQQ
ncbi:Nucleosome assembly protein (NAP) [Corchorus olitorius]|uniref:Nucleosome assembly protein (NAP) n=1 Tax=Corchorus olitorius TaxID=93759 RepID=A0A1R3H7Q8_9ROSI|nr:Nucleosome assembly protein (NAP) [Corchorus olitorius]